MTRQKVSRVVRELRLVRARASVILTTESIVNPPHPHRLAATPANLTQIWRTHTSLNTISVAIGDVSARRSKDQTSSRVIGGKVRLLDALGAGTEGHFRVFHMRSRR